MKVKELYLNQIVIVFMHHLSHQIRHRILLLPPSVTFRLFLAALCAKSHCKVVLAD